jgi:feruloyl esterase
MLGPALIRIHEKPQANWITSAKINAIRGEFMRQCDKLDGLVDGVINNYMACRENFDVKQGKPNRHPWAAKRCPNNMDPNPADTSADACLTDGQISTLEFVYSRYSFSQPLANGVKTFGMWLPNTDPSGSGLIANARFRVQEGAADNAQPYNWIGVLGMTGFLMQDLKADPLEYVEGGKYSARRQELSAILDSSNPDFSAFARRGGKMIVAIGTNDTLASPGTQLDFYQAILNKMGRSKVDSFARLYVLPQTGHGLTGTNYTTDGEGKKLEAKPIPNTFDRLALLTEWVEKGVAPDKSTKVTAGERSMPMCSWPEYPKYVKGPAEAADSWQCSAR